MNDEAQGRRVGARLVAATNRRSVLFLTAVAVTAAVTVDAFDIGAAGLLAGGADSTLVRRGALGLLGGLVGYLGLRLLDQRRELQAVRISRAGAETALLETRLEAEDRAHEARNALMAIDGAARALDRHPDLLPAPVRAELADAVATEVAHLQRIIAGGPNESHGAFTIVEALAPAVVAARSRGIHVTSTGDASATATGSRAHTREVMHNLLENARRHAPGSRVTIDARAVGGRILVRVRDHGAGVPAPEREAVFERGFRSPGAGRDGCGLGLFISRQLMRGQGGDLWVEPARDGGAEFVLALPIAPAPTGGVAPEADAGWTTQRPAARAADSLPRVALGRLRVTPVEPAR